MKNTFLLGAVTGMASLAVAVPLYATFVSAQSSSSAAFTFDGPARMMRMHGDLSQADVQALVDRDNAFLANADELLSLLKGATQTRRNDLQAAAALTDDTQRQEAVLAAHQTFHQTLQDAVADNPALQQTMPFGGAQGLRPFGGAQGLRPFGGAQGLRASGLGKGFGGPMGMMKGRGMHRFWNDTNTSQASSAQ